ncbi:MAG TPA: phosphatidylglycerol lysyltransferase domain-containing protein, partial [Conexibacter sp.]|nr:phosphatidylglycerol lysyltransferase domain-containing protein [Conexibacter sp.]
RGRRVAPALEGHGAWEHELAGRLVAAHGRDTLDPFALRADKSFHFAAGGMLAYRVVGRTAVIAGDPIGPPGCANAVLASFAALAAERGWSLAATGASAAGAAAARACRLRALEIGREAVVDPAAFTLEGRRVRKLRQSVARVERAGWEIATCDASALGDDLRRRLAEVEERWRARQPRLVGYAMTLGRLWGAPEDDDALFVVARDPTGAPRAFLRFARHAHGLSLDAMRRGEVDEPNGLGEAMIVAALRRAAAEGLAEVSLNFAGFAHVMAVDAAALPPRRRALRWALRRVHGRFQLERLARFNAKFLPVWRPRYLVYRGRRGLPLAALRVLQAEGYLRGPSSVPLPRRWEPDGRPADAAPAAPEAVEPAAAPPAIPAPAALAGAPGA